jgi:hypothetical protein
MQYSSRTLGGITTHTEGEPTWPSHGDCCVAAEGTEHSNPCKHNRVTYRLMVLLLLLVADGIIVGFQKQRWL